MEDRVLRVLRQVEEFGLENDARESDQGRRMLNLDPQTAALVSILARSFKARSVLEIGTSNGYSTLWLAWSVRGHGGRITTIDRSAEKQTLARENLSRAGLVGLVDFQYGEAAEIVARLPGPFDFVFFDADRISAPEQLKSLQSKLSDRVLLLADNALSHPAEIQAYLTAVADSLDSSTSPFRWGRV